jgi:hypothetical protein
MKLRSNLQKRSIALAGSVAVLGVVALTLTPAPAKAFVGVEVGPLAIGLGPTDPPPVVYAPPPTYTEPSVVYQSPPPVSYETYYTPSRTYYYYPSPSYSVDVYGH